MKLFTNLIVSAALATSLSGCVIIDRPGDGDWDTNGNWKQQQETNRKMISELTLGSSRQQVLTLLGAPDFSEAFTQKDGDYRILYYRTQHRHSDGETTKDETTPLIFKNDKLIGWGQKTLTTIL